MSHAGPIASVAAVSNLHAVLYRTLPLHRSRRLIRTLDVKKLAQEIGVSYQAVYAWLYKDRLPGHRARALINLEGSTLTAEMLLPFLAR